MKHLIGSVVSRKTVFICLIVMMAQSSCQSQSVQNEVVGSIPFAVLELYTSEGCSSCPAAEALLPVLKSIYKARLYILSFHVDYWNRLSWKDEFSSNMYSSRQNSYASVFKAASVYTPQTVINGTVQITGSDKNGLQRIIDKEIGNSKNRLILLTTEKRDASTCRVAYQTDLSGDEVLHIALVQLHATTNVKRGENEGRTLKHMNVVRSFETVPNSQGQIDIHFPEGMAAEQFHIMAFTQQKTDMKITSINEVAIH